MPIPPDYQAVLALVLVVAVFAGFLSERWPPEVVATAGAAAFLALGILGAEELLGALANPALVTIGALFVLSGALVRTGVLGAASRQVLNLAQDRPRLALALVLLGAVAASAFVNNTPVVMVLIPIAIQLARATQRAPSQLLLPLSYAAILGGTCTLIGTSTNILVDGVARHYGLAPFGLFEIAPLGVVVVLAGGLYMLLAATRLLPVRRTLADAFASRGSARFLTEVTVPRGSPLIGKKPSDIPPLAADDVDLLALRRRGRTFRSKLADVPLRINDRLVIAAPAHELLTMRELPGLRVGGSPSASPVPGQEVVEALVAPGRTLVGRRLADLRLPRRYGIYPLAVHRYGMLPRAINRYGREPRAELDGIRLSTGDTILLEGTPQAVADLAQDVDLLNLSQPQARPLRRRKAPLAIGALTGVVVLATLQLMPIAALAIIAAALVLITRCIEAQEAFESINGRLLMLIFAMLAVGRGLEQSGAINLIVGAITPILMEAHPLLVLAAVYGMTSLLTEMATNNAVAVIMTPLAVALATALGLDPRPFVVAVMFAASSSFATPIGYQTNTLVYSVGGYRFSDFLKIGAPMHVLIGVVCVSIIPMLWPLQPHAGLSG